MLVALAGCGDDALTVATPWPASERTGLERDFSRWLEQQPGAAAGRTRIHWIVLAPADDPARAATPLGWRPGVPDVVLGGPVASYRRMERSGRLATWRVVPRPPFGLVTSSTAPARAGEGFDDPRRDRATLAYFLSALNHHEWADAYGVLVQRAAQGRQIGRVSGSSLGAVERGELATCPAVTACPGSPARFEAYTEHSTLPEGAAVIAGGRHAALARRFLDFLADQHKAAEPPPERAGEDADGLVAELLGATLVDARDELIPAWEAHVRSKNRARLEPWITEAPPWPPASVERLFVRDGSGTLVGTLAEQLAPDPTSRAWLLRSWLEPPRPIDGRILDALGRAAGGRLAREPRFRAWLRAEWTAWARQRYHAASVADMKEPAP